MVEMPGQLSPGRKAQHTAKWARTMTKWLITFNRRKGAKWQLVDFCGSQMAESRGIVDLVAIRKNHRIDRDGLKRGDIFDIVLIQVKGGSAQRPTAQDIARLRSVARYHRAKAVVLADWKRGERLGLSVLMGSEWRETSPESVFG